MKRILIIPKDATGIVDVRKIEHLVLEQVSFVEQITQEMIKNGMSTNTHKFAQFEQDEAIPIVVKVSDKISNGVIMEFSTELVSFKDSGIEDTNELIEQRYLSPMIQERSTVLQSVLEAMVLEKIGVEVKQSEFDGYKEDYEKIDKKIKDFRHVHYMKKMI